MKKIIIGTLIGLILVIIILTVGASTNGVPHLVYVYSNSMEPLIMVNDAFIVIPSHKVAVGDIIMYRPIILKPDFVTHRIVGLGNNGFITKGDNSPYVDQESGEPEVKRERVVGKVLTIGTEPVVFRKLGNFSIWVKTIFGKYTGIVSAAILLLAILNIWRDRKFAKRRLKSHYRWRLGHIYKTIAFLAFMIAIGSIYWGSRTTPISYLVSEYPTKLEQQVEVNQEGQLKLNTNNKGLMPVWRIIEVEKPLSRLPKAELIWPRTEKVILIGVMPQQKTGLYKGYIRIYNYPAVMPQSVLWMLHKNDPNLAILGTGIMVWLIFSICCKLLDRIQGLESWIPLKGIKDKIIKRRTHRIMARVLGRKRV